MPWKRLNEENSTRNDERERTPTMATNSSAEALLALNALLSASSGLASMNEASSSASNSADNLTNLLSTLANFSAKLPTGGDDDGGGVINEIHRQEMGNSNNSNNDIASFFVNAFANAKSDPEPSTMDEYDRYEQEREEKFRELKEKYGFLSPKKPKLETPKEKPPSLGLDFNLSTNQSLLNNETFAASARKVLGSSAMKEFLSGYGKNRMDTAPASVSSTLSSMIQKAAANAAHKRRARSSTSSSKSSSGSDRSSRSSSTESDRSTKGKKKKNDRSKKKSKKAKKEKEKNGKNSSSSKKSSKLKKDLLVAERKAIADRVSNLKASLSDYEKRRRTMDDELTRLKKQHNEMCRKLQRQKSDPRKDTLIMDNEALQTDIEKHLKQLEKDRENDKKILEAEEKRLEKLKKQAKMAKKEDEAISIKRASESTSDTPAAAVTKKAKEENIDYFDPGSHWCKNCGVVSPNVYEWLEHLHSQKHKSNMDSLDRPWMPEQVKAPIKSQGVAALKPFKGVEFLMPSTAFYCNLCKEFSGDSLAAEAHLKSGDHNAKYQAYVESNPFYERREMLEKAAAVSHRLEKTSASSKSVSTNVDDQRPKKHLESVGVKPVPKSQSQRVPHKPNESGKIKPFQVSTTPSSSHDKDKSTSSSSKKGDEKRSSSGFVMKVADPKKSTATSSSNSSSTLKKPHSAFLEKDGGGEKSKYESSRSTDDRNRRSTDDRKRYRDY